MDIAARTHECRAAPSPGASAGGTVRQVVELIVTLSLCILLVRAFCAEAYVVPTGSMAPTLLGLHHELTCERCRFVYMVGAENEPRECLAVCPNCGHRAPDGTPLVESGGDRVLVQKWVYNFRRPRRWEAAVFHFPGEPSQAYVKRVVGLPGETITIKDGDVYVDGRIARKSLDELRAMWVLVHDARFDPGSGRELERWAFRTGTDAQLGPTGWQRQGDHFVHADAEISGREAVDWLAYKHWEPSQGGYGPIKDFYGYNGGDLRADNDVCDVAFEARLVVTQSVHSLALELRSSGDRFLVKIPVTDQGDIELMRNDRSISVSNINNYFQRNSSWPRRVSIAAAVCDQRLQVALDGVLLFDPYDYADPLRERASSDSPLALGVRGDALEVADLRVFRDVYYTSVLAGTPRHSQLTRRAATLGSDDYFVLGDNSPVSNDSRFWGEGPVVPGSMFVGKPFLVHLPGQVVPLKVFGRSVCWVPDPRRIRYIR